MTGSVPKISRPLLRFFGKYATGHLRRYFHSLRLLKNAGPPLRAVDASLWEARGLMSRRIDSAGITDTHASQSEAATGPDVVSGPLVVFLNHAAWWDPLVCLFLARHFFPQWNCYAPMAALSRYRFFQRLGFFPVEIGTARGAAQFLHNSEAILEQPRSALFLTPQGKFSDVRAPLQFAPGIEHLATRVPRARFLPLAIEYTFWEERKPEVLFGFGESGSNGLSERLAAAQSKLAAAAQRRQPNEWTILLKSKSGASRPYDLWRWLRARFRGEAFTRDHSSL